MRFLKRLVRVLLVIALLVVGAAGLVVWRLRHGPVPLDFLVPRITAALAKGDGDPWQVQIDGLELVWASSAHHAQLLARGLRIARPGGGASMTLHEVRIALDRRALLHGDVVVTSIELDGPTVELARETDGHLAIQFVTSPGEKAGTGWLPSMMRRLQHVAIRDGQVTLVDEATGRTWTVPNVDGDAWRSGGPIRVQVSMAVDAGDVTVPLWIDALYQADAGSLDVEMWSRGGATTALLAAWPPEMAPAARAWLTSHVSDGEIRQIVVTASGHGVQDGGLKLALDTVHATVAFQGLTVRYLDTMAPVVGVEGAARFTRDGVDVTVTSGRLDALAVGPATVRVAWPDPGKDSLAIDARCRGPLASLVGVLDRPPVALGERVSFQAGGIDGTTSTHLRLAFPLSHPTPGKLGLQAKTTITDATVPYIAGGWEVTGGTATVEVDDRSLAIDGTAALRGIPIGFEFRDHFNRPASRRLEVSGRLTPDDLRTLGADTGSLLTGPVDATLRFAPEPDGRWVADIEANLTPAALDVPALAFDKPPGQVGRAVARLTIARGLVTAVERFDVTAGATSLRGNAGRPARVGPWSRVDGTLRIRLPDRREDEGASMQIGLVAQNERWKTTITSRDVGLLLQGYGYDGVRGGRMSLEGTSDVSAGGLVFDGRLTVESTTFSRVPALLKLVSLVSVRGLLDVGSGQQVTIDRLVATVAHRPPSTVEIRELVARGPNLSLTLDGTYDHDTDGLAMRGTLIPSYYFLNDAARIPVLGRILGRSGGGVQAVDFKIAGRVGDPVVSVQPVSSLAPGVLGDWLRKLGL